MASNIFGQDLSDSDSFVNHRFKGGQLELRKYLASHMIYPEKSAIAGVVGVSFSSCDITPEGKMEGFKIINSLDKAIDKHVKDLILSTSKLWGKSDLDSTTRIYFQLGFIMTAIDYNPVELNADNVVQMVFTVAAIGGFDHDVSDKYLMQSINENINKKDYSNATLMFVNEAIRRYPYDPKLYQTRILLNSKLGNKEQVMFDVNLTSSFVNGQPLETLVNNR